MRKERKSILEYLPIKFSEYIGFMIPAKEQIVEIRIRVYQPLCVRTIEREYIFSDMVMSENDIENIFHIVTEFSAYAFENSIKNGFITVEGGHRIGICGEMVYENGKMKCMNHISYLNMRSAKEVYGCGKEIYEALFDRKEFENTLIFSSPGKGKTTLLRDLIRMLSNEKYHITVVDERNEISAGYKGKAQNDLGPRTDVITSCKKKDGISMAVRAMAPQIIAVDEIGSKEDVEGLWSAKRSGVRILATAHSDKINEVKQEFGELFEKYIYIERIGEYQWF